MKINKSNLHFTKILNLITDKGNIFQDDLYVTSYSKTERDLFLQLTVFGLRIDTQNRPEPADPASKKVKGLVRTHLFSANGQSAQLPH